MRPRFILTALTLAACVSAPHLLVAQEGTWWISAGGGLNLLAMTDVNRTLDQTVSDWNTNQNVPIGPIDHFRLAPGASARIVYRYSRDMSVSLSSSYLSRTVNDSYNDPTISLSLERSIQAGDALFGVSYYFPPLVFDIDTYVIVEVGWIFAKSQALTYNTQTTKTGPTSTQTVVNYDTHATYSKARSVASLGIGAVIPVWSGYFVKTEFGYKFANIGQMDGEVRRLQGTTQETSSAEFDFSAFVISVALGITF